MGELLKVFSKSGIKLWPPQCQHSQNQEPSACHIFVYPINNLDFVFKILIIFAED